ncbi:MULTISPECIES: CdaR family protein [unclassified Sporolactobacillus]|uniref:CdaR family protein n=1 Tax=unclassified Sporolactobacillus TaxID=2628533 RepID=UPI00236896B9|nr:CdaR family protein [Sporolactobacillus sp. CQH2019]MDD9150000.1 CdaR family protein [Sporolactobacillus sp. CQH2019]
MDKLLRKNWLVKIISFVIALMLYAIVNAGQTPSSTPSSVITNQTQQMMITEGLDVRYNSNQYVVSGAPRSVNLRLNGSNDLILKAKLLTMKSAFIDLTNMKSGTYDVQVQTQGFPTGLKVTPVPSSVRVTIQKKTSKELPVAVDILDKSKVGAGLLVGDPVIDPRAVTVTGGEDTVNSIAFIKGVVSVKNASATVDRMITLHAYDSTGKEVDVSIEPSAVHVQVPVTRVSKQLSIQAVTTGTPASGYSVGSIDLSANTVNVIAPDENTLSTITGISPLSVSVDGLSGDKTFSVDVPVPSGATRVSPAKVDVTVHIVKSSSSTGSGSSASSAFSSSGQYGSKNFQSIPLTMTGLSSGRNATFTSANHVDVSVTGNSQDLNNLTAKDIQASVDLSGLGTGRHQVTVDVTVPNGLSAHASPGSVGVSIS